MTKGRYVLTVRSAGGEIVRQHRYRTLKEIRLSDAAPTLEEMIEGHSGEVRNGRSRPWAWEPVNPKVLPLVKALLAAGIVTTGSGDLYSDDLVYVDLADGWEETIAKAPLLGWTVSAKLGDATREALGLPAEWVPGVPSDEPVEGVLVEGDGFHPAVRLSRRGGTVTPQEAEGITAALLSATEGPISTP